MKQLSLIVAVLESYEVVRRQLLHLERVLTPSCELILVDDGSDPPLQATCDAVKKTYSFTLYCTQDRRPWTQPRARNLGAALAQADKLLFFDIDHVITPDILEECLRYPGDKLHWFRKQALLDEHGDLVTDPATLVAHGGKEPEHNVHSNSFLIRREFFQRLGGYDERFCGRYGGDDVDFNFRYARLCNEGVAWPVDVRGEGYVISGREHNGKPLFHSLPRDRE